MKLIKQTFTQDPHCCIDSDVDYDPSFSFELHDGGGGTYLVMHCAHWAVDTNEEIDALALKMKEMLHDSI